jgi:hypothetical protein
MRKRSIALVLATAALVIGTVFGTMAWLSAKSGPVTNTFTTSDITVTLEETTGKEYKMVPGYTITKDPKVTVKAGSEPCYLFVKLEKSSNFDTFLTYTVADGWTQLKDAQDTDVSGVYYRRVEAADIGKTFSVLKDNQVTVNSTVTKEQMSALTESSSYPTLTVTAYASQLMENNTEEFTAIEAWNNVDPSAAAQN